METLYADYFWQKGVPKGRRKIGVPPSSAICYKIITDPYRKRFSIEQYEKGAFKQVVYDSIYLDFRRLKPSEQQGWQQEVISQSDREIVCLIRNQEERVLYREIQEFEGSFCRSCSLYAPQGLLLSIHRMSYTALGDAFDGTLLYDGHTRLVLAKRYQSSEQGEFTELLEERWDLEDASFLNAWEGQKGDQTRLL